MEPAGLQKITMSNVVKIYEVKTLGYSQLEKELEAINQLFENIRLTKKSINLSNLDATADKAQLAALNAEVTAAKVKTGELRLERQKLINEAKVLQNIEQQNINKTKEGTEAIEAQAGSLNDLIAKKDRYLNIANNHNENTAEYSKAIGEVARLAIEIKRLQDVQKVQSAATKVDLQAEANSLNDLIAKRRELGRLVGNIAPGNISSVVEHNDQTFNREEGIIQLKRYEAEINRLREEQKLQSISTQSNIKAEAGSLTDLIQKRERYQSIVSNSNENTSTYSRAIGEVVRLESEIRRLRDEQRLQSTEAKIEIQAEAGSLNNLIAKRKELGRATGNIAPGNNLDTVEHNGQTFNRTEAIAQLKLYETEIKRLKEEEKLQSTSSQAGITAEVGSLDNLIARRKELNALTNKLNPNSQALIPFEGSINTYDQAISKIKVFEAEIQRLKEIQKSQTISTQAEVGSLNDLIAKRERYKTIVNNANENTTTYSRAIGEVVRLESEIQRLKEEQRVQSQSAVNGVLVEERSLTDLINKRKELTRLINSQDEGNHAPIQFNGQAFTRPEAVAEVNRMSENIARLRGQFETTETVGQRMTNSINQGFSNMRGQLQQLTLTYLGWFAAFQQAGKFIEENIKLSDSFSDLQIRIHGTKEEVEQLFSELKNIDTRTSLTSLVDIANVVAKKGVDKSEIAGLTKEFDKLNVVLGHELGDPASSAASIIKLITIFNDDKHVTAERVQEIGASLTKLTTTGVATGEFLINFAERVGAVRGITGLTLPSILGMGAALQQLGQRTEVAGTAAVQLTTKLFTDVPKFAKAAKMSVEDFRATLARDPFEALVKVAEGLKDLSGDKLHTNFEEIVTAFGEVGVTGVRIKAVLSDIATNGAFVSQRMKQAAVNSADYANQTAALELKQNNLAATVEKVKKVFESLATNKSVQVTLAAIGTVVLFLVNSLGVLIPIIATYGVIWGIANASMIKTRIAAMLLNAQITLQYAGLVIASTFQRAYAVSMSLMTGATNAATASTTLLNIAMRLLPIGIVITLIAFLAAACTTAANKVGTLTDAMRKKAAADKAVVDINDMANRSIAETVTKMDLLANIVTSTNTSIDTQRDALAKLTEMNGKFGTVVLGNADSLTKFKQVMNEVKADMIKFAQSQAAQQLSTDKYNDYLTSIKQRQELERIGANPANQIPSKNGPIIKIPNDKENDFLGLGVLATDFYGPKQFKAKIDELKTIEKEKFQIYTDFLEVAQHYKLDADAAAKKEEGFKPPVDIDKLSATEIEALIKDINKQLKQLKEGDPKIEELRVRREALRKRLKDIMGNPVKPPKLKEYRGARLTGEDRDILNEIDAQMKNQQALEDLAYTQSKLNHNLTAQEELNHINRIRVIDTIGVQHKIDYLNSLKTLNAKQKEDLATFNKQKADIELKAADDSQKIRDTEFTRRQTDLKKVLERNINNINLDTTTTSADQSLSNTDRAQIKLNNDKKILDLQVKYNTDIDVLEKQLNQHSKENTLQGSKTRQQIIEDSILIMNSRFKDAAEAADQVAAEFQTAASNQIIKIIENGGSATKIAREIAKVQEELRKNLLVNQIAQQKIELELYKKGLSEKLKSEKEYQEALAKLKGLEAQLAKDSADAGLTTMERFKNALKEFKDSFLSGVFKIPKYENTPEGQAQKQADAIKESQNTIAQALKEGYDNYFRNQSAQIDKEREMHQERLDRERDLLKSRAQSQAEMDSLDNQYAAKKKDLDRKAGEDKKKLALKQLAIDYALSIVKALAQYGLPLALIPIAASTALYFVQKAGIQSQQFEFGGKPGEVPTSGGKFGGKPHSKGGTDFEFKSKRYNAEVDELAIIRTKNASATQKYTITGTQMQIASKLNKLGGGVDFHSGATVGRKFEKGGVLGTRYPAPSYNINSSNINSNNIADYLLEIRNLATEQSNRFDRLEVYQVTSTVTNAQKKQVKQSQIGVLS